MRKLFLTTTLILALVTILGSCGSENSSKESASQPAAPKPTPLTSISTSPGALTPQSTLEISVSIEGDSVRVDSMVIFFESVRLASSQATSLSASLAPLPLGKQTLTAKLFLNNGGTEQHALPLILLAETPPQKFDFRKIETYTHDPDAYTQGLLYHGGFLYESTGTRGESTLRKVDISTGKVLQQTPLDSRYFGEGLAFWDNSLIQLTWTSKIGFVYDLESFEQKRTFNYSTEGWGLASTDTELVMSDGTEYLYFLDPVTLAETRRIQVYNHQEKILYLNELEVVGGLIYANVYQTDVIVMIDPLSGAVVGDVSLEGIFNKQGYSRRLDVLNGIAWDEKEKRLFVTGKWWPKLYQIELFKIQS
ncbi:MULTISPECIES: glutaminyl-peptide cyclotransferase [unclassified Imperialibacter]|uniref:glutaminyl-peptide cyclotransferase n=1 Tax=unclassified Imperialibacter TaxID=2629706 RepID=UPI001259319B|nr:MULTISPECIES: glutaminyl-peptide cyclotransferase [unclassified Imperialibacter]CAD5292785.1 Glutamine cyclotransferase [Imperialibacter sp. 89]CAD5293834.1 Glutamine cyclotransferase [Imperialibacter sp. 75]VVT28649.1 putative Glutamine cyclotransferase [Imperialibacter sp. EC-SDR9]